jgi:hypothetical protein
MLAGVQIFLQEALRTTATNGAHVKRLRDADEAHRICDPALRACRSCWRATSGDRLRSAPNLNSMPDA